MGKGARNAHVKGKNYGGSKARDRTRAEKPKLIEDPELEEKVLSAQLREAGLYAANILGDGNCLFRALADQLYGSPSMHLAIRHEICDHLAANADRYRLFVDEDSVKGGFEGHVREMRQPGTYGTNIELCFRRSVSPTRQGVSAEPRLRHARRGSPSRHFDAALFVCLAGSLADAVFGGQADSAREAPARAGRKGESKRWETVGGGEQE